LRNVLLFITLSSLLISGCATSSKKNISSVTVSAVGDIFMGGTSAPIMANMGYDYPFETTKPLYLDSDIVIGNLEGPLTSQGNPVLDKYYVYRTPINKVAPALAQAGFDIVTLANNHSLDYGITGLRDTIISLEKHHIAHIGAGRTLKEARKAHVFERNGLKIGFLGYPLTFPEEYWANEKQGGTSFAREEFMREDLQILRKKVDCIVVSFHWGRELQTELRPYQTRMGRMAIDEGADVVIGHHPHIMQGIERYKNGVLLYSLGNYVFGSYSNKVQFGGIAKIILDQKGFKQLEVSLIDINNFRQQFQPKLLQEPLLSQSLTEIIQLSNAQKTKLLIQDGKLTLER